MVDRYYIPEYPVTTYYLSLKKDGREKFYDRVIYTSYGRIALESIFSAKVFSGNSNILVPSFLCSVVVEPFVKRNLKIKYYQIDKKLQYDLNNIKSLVDDKTVAVYIIHYFGFEQNISEIVKFCKDNNLVLIEDCAHSLFGRYGDKYLGSWGDVAVYSFRKFLPIPDGGGYLLNNTEFLPPLTKGDKRGFKTNISGWLKILLKRFCFKAKINFYEIKKIIKKNSDVTKKDDLNTKGLQDISIWSKRVIEHSNESYIAYQRRINFEFYINNINKIKNIVPIFTDLPDGIIPFAFPILLDERDKVRDEMQKRGIFLEATFSESPLLKFDVVMNKTEDFVDTKYLSDHLLSLPVYQGLKEKHLKFILNELNQCLSVAK